MNVITRNGATGYLLEIHGHQPPAGNKRLAGADKALELYSVRRADHHLYLARLRCPGLLLAAMGALGGEAGLEVSAHVLRHSFATNLVCQGHDLVLVTELTGHARLETVRRYSLSTARDLKPAIETLPVDR